MSIQDHANRADQFLQAFPLFTPVVEKYLNAEEIILNSSLPTVDEVDEDGCGVYHGWFDEDETAKVQKKITDLYHFLPRREIGFLTEAETMEDFNDCLTALFEAELDEFLPKLNDYLTRLPPAEFAQKKALIAELKTLTGFLFWQPIYMRMIMIADEEIYRVERQRGAAQTNKNYSSAKRKAAWILRKQAHRQ